MNSVNKSALISVCLASFAQATEAHTEHCDCPSAPLLVLAGLIGGVALKVLWDNSRSIRSFLRDNRQADHDYHIDQADYHLEEAKKLKESLKNSYHNLKKLGSTKADHSIQRYPIPNNLRRILQLQPQPQFNESLSDEGES